VNINSRSTKAQIIAAATELTNSQARCISDLQQRQVVLIALLGVLIVLQLL
jgi:hypothetical protein